MTMTKTQRIERTIGGIAGVICTGLLVAGLVASVSAQGDPAPGPTRGERVGPRGGFGGLFGPGGPGPFGRGGMRLPGLTDAQRDQIRNVREQHRDELRRLTEQAMTARRALQASVAQGQVDESKAAEVGAAASALALAQARVQGEILALLTPEQRQQIQTRREEMRRWFESRPDGGRRGRGGPGGPGERRGR